MHILKRPIGNLYEFNSLLRHIKHLGNSHDFISYMFYWIHLVFNLMLYCVFFDSTKLTQLLSFAQFDTTIQPAINKYLGNSHDCVWRIDTLDCLWTLNDILYYVFQIQMYFIGFQIDSPNRTQCLKTFTHIFHSHNLIAWNQYNF